MNAFIESFLRLPGCDASFAIEQSHIMNQVASKKYPTGSCAATEEADMTLYVPGEVDDVDASVGEEVDGCWQGA